MLKLEIKLMNDTRFTCLADGGGDDDDDDGDEKEEK